MHVFADKNYDKKYGMVPSDEEERIVDIFNRKIKNKKMLAKLMVRLEELQTIQWSKISFCIYTDPKATPRPRINSFTHTFYVKGAANNRKQFKQWMSTIDHPYICTPFKFQCDTYSATPSSMNSIETVLAEFGLIRPLSRPDWDNLGKTYSDMIHEGLILDDSLIIDGRVRKFYSVRPRVEIFIEYMDDFDSLYNEKKMKGRENRDEENSIHR